MLKLFYLFINGREDFFVHGALGSQIANDENSTGIYARFRNPVIQTSAIGSVSFLCVTFMADASAILANREFVSRNREAASGCRRRSSGIWNEGFGFARPAASPEQ
jgi:hypothetical protein